jgi:hypothetical protein
MLKGGPIIRNIVFQVNTKKPGAVFEDNARDRTSMGSKLP